MDRNNLIAFRNEFTKKFNKDWKSWKKDKIHYYALIIDGLDKAIFNIPKFEAIK